MSYNHINPIGVCPPLLFLVSKLLIIKGKFFEIFNLWTDAKNAKNQLMTYFTVTYNKYP